MGVLQLLEPSCQALRFWGYGLETPTRLISNPQPMSNPLFVGNPLR